MVTELVAAQSVTMSEMETPMPQEGER